MYILPFLSRHVVFEPGSELATTATLLLSEFFHQQKQAPKNGTGYSLKASFKFEKKSSKHSKQNLKLTHVERAPYYIWPRKSWGREKTHWGSNHNSQRDACVAHLLMNSIHWQLHVLILFPDGERKRNYCNEEKLQKRGICCSSGC